MDFLSLFLVSQNEKKERSNKLHTHFFLYTSFALCLVFLIYILFKYCCCHLIIGWLFAIKTVGKRGKMILFFTCFSQAVWVFLDSCFGGTVCFLLISLILKQTFRLSFCLSCCCCCSSSHVLLVVWFLFGFTICMIQLTSSADAVC